MSTLRADNYSDRLGSSSIPAATLLQGTAKAWFNLNGTGTIAGRDSFNISSFTDNGTGDYSGNFTAAMPNANYAVEVAARVTGAITLPTSFSEFNTASLVRAGAMTTAFASVDATFENVTVHGDPA